MQVVVGIDIGGTKCAVSFAKQHSDDIEFLDKVRMKTETESFDRAMESFIRIIREKFSQNPDWQLMSIGISCGGPLDAEKGLILSPPNLLKWEKADVYTPLKKEFGVPVMLRNDADACALAEWSMGAGKGCKKHDFPYLRYGYGSRPDSE